jgi:carbamoyl-phosphate synthase large subunit
MRILVTGLGGPAGANVVSLMPPEAVVAACDANPAKRSELERAGRPGVRFYTVPHARSQESFIRAVNQIIVREGIDTVIPTVDEELMVFSYRPGHFNARVVVSPYRTVSICNDKALLYESMKDQPFCPRYIVTDSRKELLDFAPGSVFVKPRIGRGSRGARLFRDAGDVPNELITKANVFCEYLPGQEYTVDLMCDLSGRPVLAVPRKRLEVSRGISVAGETERNPEIEESVIKICGILSFIGPTNLQFKAGSSGRFMLVEINPRFSGGLPITAEAGANMPLLLHDMLAGRQARPPEWREGIFRNTIAR